MLTLDICDQQTPGGSRADEVDSWLYYKGPDSSTENAAESHLKHVIKFRPNDQFHPKFQHDVIITKVYDNKLCILELKRDRVWILNCKDLEYLSHTDTCVILKLNIELGAIESWKSAITSSCSLLIGLIDVSAISWLEDDEAPTGSSTTKSIKKIPNLQVFRIPEPYRMGCLMLEQQSSQQYVLALASDREVVKCSYKTVGYNDGMLHGLRVKEYAVDELKALYREPDKKESITTLSIIGDKLFWCTRDALRIIDLRTHEKIGYVKLKDQAAEGLSLDNSRYILRGGKSQIVVITGTGCIITIRLVAKSVARGISATMAHVCGRDHVRCQPASEKPERMINVINKCYMMEGFGNILVYYDHQKVGIADTSGCIMAAQLVHLDNVTTCHGFDALRSIDGHTKIYARLLSESEQIMNSLRRNSEGSRLTQTLKLSREWLYKTENLQALEKVAELLYVHQESTLLIDASVLGPAKKGAYIRGCLRAAVNKPTTLKSSSSTHEVIKYFQRCMPLDTMIIYLDMSQQSQYKSSLRYTSCLRDTFQHWSVMSALIAAVRLLDSGSSFDYAVAPDLINACVYFDYSTPADCIYLFLIILMKNPVVFGKASYAVTPENIEKFCQLPYTLCQHVNRLIDQIDLTPNVTIKTSMLMDICSAVPTRLNHLDLYCRSLHSGTQEFVCILLKMMLRNYAELLAHIQTLIPVLICYTIFTKSFEWNDEAVATCSASPECCQIVLSYLKDMFRSIVEQANFRLKVALSATDVASRECKPNLTFLARARRLASTNDQSMNPQSPKQIPWTHPGPSGSISPDNSPDMRRSCTQARPQGLARRDSILTFAQSPAPKPIMRGPTDRRRFCVASPTFLLQFPEDIVTAGEVLSTENWLSMTFNADTAISVCCFGIKIGKIAHVFEILLKSQFMLWAGLLLIFGELHDSIADYREALRLTGCHNKKCVHYEKKLSGDSFGSTGSSEEIQEHLLAQGRCALNLADIVSMILDDKHSIHGTWEYELVKACSDEPKVAAQNFFSSAQARCVGEDVQPPESRGRSRDADPIKQSFVESSQGFDSIESEISTPRLPSAQWTALEVMHSIFNLQWSPYNALRRISTVAEVGLPNGHLLIAFSSVHLGSMQISP